jgi:hypothetical protein
MNDKPARVPLHWLDGGPNEPTGVTCGVSWPRGALAAGAPVHLQCADGRALPTQTWPLAWWPDGSVKWLGLAVVAQRADGETLTVARGAGPAPAHPVTVTELGIEIFRRIETGAITVDVGDRGTAILQEIRLAATTTLVSGACGSTAGGAPRTVAGAANLVAVMEQRAQESGSEVRRRVTSLGVVSRLVVEQSGPVRALVKLEGRHRDPAGREWLPFTVRLAFWTGLTQIDVVESVVFDGDPERDFIAGLGLRCHVPLLDAPDNRHVRFAGAGGVWCEPSRYAHLNAPESRQLDQLAARRVEPRGEDLLLPAWDDFRLEQESADHFAIRKRQAGPVSWVEAGHGLRAPGLAAVSDPGGGLAMGMEDFWQSYPTALAVDGLTGTETTLTAWFWSDEAAPMDLRHYGVRDHRPVYEAVNPDPVVYSSARGIAHTSRLRFWVLAGGCTHETLQARARTAAGPPLLVADPGHYAACRVFGPWQPADRSTPARAALEDELDRQLAFFRDQVEERRWYGFWNYGDLMHSYDHQRHVWRYDIGGCAWNNAELAADLWLWYAFLRTGRADLFRLATAMTRHVAEVDSFHLGVWNGQGSRHNVSHWGCPCKEPRVCAAGPKRFLCYLTADERMGDLLDEVAESHRGRATNVPTDPDDWRARIGPTWATFCANWLAAWERSGDTKWRDLILRGIEGILASPHRLLTGTPFKFDPATGAMTYAGDHPYHANRLVSIFGGAEGWMELTELLDHAAFADAVAEYGRVHAATVEESGRLPETLTRTLSLRYPVAKLAAFAAVRDNDPALAARAWELLLTGDVEVTWDQINWSGAGPDVLRGGTVQETGLALIDSSQWGLNVMFLLGLAPAALEEAARKTGWGPGKMRSLEKAP